MNKILRYAKQHQNNDEVVSPIRAFIKAILDDSNRCLRISDDEIGEIPESVLKKLAGGNYGSDQFLFEAATCIEEEKLIITTDQRLQEHFQDENWCRLVLLADFLEGY